MQALHIGFLEKRADRHNLSVRGDGSQTHNICDAQHYFDAFGLRIFPGGRLLEYSVSLSERFKIVMYLLK